MSGLKDLCSGFILRPSSIRIADTLIQIFSASLIKVSLVVLIYVTIYAFFNGSKFLNISNGNSNVFGKSEIETCVAESVYS